MALETGTYISDLVSSNPASSDAMSAADDHLRLIKATVKASFPNITGAVSRTHTDINTGVAWAVQEAARSSSVPTGAIMDFWMTSPPAGWLTCDGQAVPQATYPALHVAMGSPALSGGNFNLPNLRSRFRRHRDNSTLSSVVGTLQSPKNLSHTHGVNINTGDDSPGHTHHINFNSQDRNQGHTHTFSGTTNPMNSNQSHNHGISNARLIPQNGAAGGGVGGGGAFAPFDNPSAAFSINSTNTDHTHGFGGTTDGENQGHVHQVLGDTEGRSAFHQHNVNGNTGTGTADDANEARPYSATVLTCIKT